jgi:D-alanine-D-alanine ligase
MSQLCIGLIFGGQSGEHEVSIASAQAIDRGLSQNSDYKIKPFYIQKNGLWCGIEDSQIVLKGDRSIQSTFKPAETGQRFPSSIAEIDLWFPVLHGPYGEDGTVQGMLQLLQKPYVGNGVLAAAVGMDKILMKSCFAQAGLAQVKYLGLNRWQWQQESQSWAENIELELGYPCFVKPSNLGSSVGISKVRDRAELIAGINQALKFDPRLIVEQSVIAREIECAVLGNENPQASVVGEITFHSDFYDYETKYTPGKAELIIPAKLPIEVTEAMQSMAVRAFQTLAGSGLARVDFFYVEASGTVLINEINTMPGFTATSMYPKLWEASGIKFAELCDRLVKLGLAQIR